jgi:hypothetical protein
MAKPKLAWPHQPLKPPLRGHAAGPLPPQQSAIGSTGPDEGYVEDAELFYRKNLSLSPVRPAASAAPPR